MARDFVLESKEERFERFQDAVTRRQRWDHQFNQAYRFMMPQRLVLNDDNFTGTSSLTATRGDPRHQEIFDNTGEDSLFSFADNMQISLMPSFTKWAEIDLVENADLPDHIERKFGKIDKSGRDDIKKQLSRATNTLFHYFDFSGLENKANEAFLDLGISTGVMMVNQGDFKNPLMFSAVPANQVIIEGGVDESLANFWRPVRMAGRNVKLKWPRAKIDGKLAETIKNDPNAFVNLIEGTLFYPQNPEGKQFYYFVMTEDGMTEILTEFRPFDPWIAFRGRKSPGEIYGRGPAMIALPFVRTLTKLSDFMVQGLEFQSVPIFVASSTADINPYTMFIRPGSIIPVDSTLTPREAITRLDTGSNATLPFEVIQNLQMIIKEIMFANPIGPSGLPNKTATETTIINNNWIRKNAGFFGRVIKEFFPPLINKSFTILHSMGLVPLIDVNGIKIPIDTQNGLFKLKFTTALEDLQDEQDLQAIARAFQMNTEMMGQEGALSFNIEELPITVSEKNQVPKELINYEWRQSPVVNGVKGTLQGQQMPPQQTQTVPGETTPTADQQVANQVV